MGGWGEEEEEEEGQEEGRGGEVELLRILAQTPPLHVAEISFAVHLGGK